MPDNYRQLMRKMAEGFSWSPPDSFGDRYTGILALYQDIATEGSNQAIRSGYSSIAFQPPDALIELSSDYNLPRYPGETDAGFKARLDAKWVTWESAGAAASMEAQLTALGFTSFTRFVARDFDPASPDWSRFILVFDSGTHPVTPDGTWGDPGNWGDGGYWGIATGGELMPALLGIVCKFKAAHVRPQALTFLTSGEVWGLPIGGLWSDPGTWGGTGVVITGGLQCRR